jgi:hypothetical protein
MGVDFSRKVCVPPNASSYLDQSPLSGGERVRERGVYPRIEVRGCGMYGCRFSRKVCGHLNASPYRDKSPLSGGERVRERCVAPRTEVRGCGF